MLFSPAQTRVGTSDHALRSPATVAALREVGDLMEQATGLRPVGVSVAHADLWRPGDGGYLVWVHLDEADELRMVHDLDDVISSVDPLDYDWEGMERALSDEFVGLTRRVGALYDRAACEAVTFPVPPDRFAEPLDDEGGYVHTAETRDGWRHHSGKVTSRGYVNETWEPAGVTAPDGRSVTGQVRRHGRTFEWVTTLRVDGFDQVRTGRVDTLDDAIRDLVAAHDPATDTDTLPADAPLRGSRRRKAARALTRLEVPLTAAFNAIDDLDHDRFGPRARAVLDAYARTGPTVDAVVALLDGHAGLTVTTDRDTLQVAAGTHYVEARPTDWSTVVVAGPDGLSEHPTGLNPTATNPASIADVIVSLLS